MGSGSKPNCPRENSPQTCLGRETCPTGRKKRLGKKPGESARAFVSAGGVGKVSLVRQYTDMLRIPSPADVDATTFLETIFKVPSFVGNETKKHLQDYFPSQATLQCIGDLKCVILVGLQAGQCEAFSFRRLVQHLAHLPLPHGAVVDGEAFEQAVHRLGRRWLPREGEGCWRGGGAGEGGGSEAGNVLGSGDEHLRRVLWARTHQVECLDDEGVYECKGRGQNYTCTVTVYLVNLSRPCMTRDMVVSAWSPPPPPPAT